MTAIPDKHTNTCMPARVWKCHICKTIFPLGVGGGHYWPLTRLFQNTRWSHRDISLQVSSYFWDHLPATCVQIFVVIVRSVAEIWRGGKEPPPPKWLERFKYRRGTRDNHNDLHNTIIVYGIYMYFFWCISHSKTCITNDMVIIDCW